MKEIMNVEVTFNYSLSVDKTSDEFITALQCYNEIIFEHGNADDMIEYVVNSIITNGPYDLIEGVGYVKINGYITKPELYCGIDLINKNN